jgi:hypothetical protein
MPAIADILSEHAVGRFGANLKASLIGKGAVAAQAQEESEQ